MDRFRCLQLHDAGDHGFLAIEEHGPTADARRSEDTFVDVFLYEILAEYPVELEKRSSAPVRLLLEPERRDLNRPQRAVRTHLAGVVDEVDVPEVVLGLGIPVVPGSD